MPTYERLTDRTLATGVTLTDFIHIVITGDTTQNVAGSSYKASIQQVADAITGATGSGTSGTNGTSGSSGTNGTSGTDGTSGSSGSSGLSGLGLYLPLSGGTVTGETIFQSGLTANTLNISSTPSTDETNSKVLVRNTTTGNIEERTIPLANVYGLYSQTGNATPISATTSETTLINGGVGSLEIPANIFQVGDSFRVLMGGIINAGNNEDIQIRIKSGSVTLADSGMQNLVGSTNDIWMLEINFVIRATGGTGTAEIVTLGNFTTYKSSNNTATGFAFNTVNNTTFDTTTSNTLDITAQWDTASVSNSIYSDIFTLRKIY